MPSDSFGLTEVRESWTVPSGISQVDIYAAGGSGAGGNSEGGIAGNGGNAGEVTVVKYPASPGETYYVRVGGNGGNVSGGYNGGGEGDDISDGGGGGGGASDIRTSGDSLSDRIVVAGGGGGGGGVREFDSGGDGGHGNGGDGEDGAGNYGGSGGIGGGSSDELGENGTFSGGGGGGGYNGGTAGKNQTDGGNTSGGGGGGGGTSYVTSSGESSTVGVTNNSQEITFSYAYTPTNLSVVDEGYRSVELSWDSDSSDSYNIYRNGNLIANTTSSSYTDSNVSPATSYSYSITAVDSGAESEKTSSVSATTGGNSPDDFTVNAGSRQVSLSWTDTNSDEDGYEIHRSTSANVDTSGTPITTTSANVESYTDTEANLDGREYHYRVVAVLSDERGNDSQELSAITDLPAPTNLSHSNTTKDSTDYSWSATHNTGDTRVEYRESGNTTWQTFGTVSYDVEFETVAGLLNGTSYESRIVAVTSDTESVGPTNSFLTILPDEDQPIVQSNAEDEVFVDRESAVSNTGNVRYQIRRLGENEWNTNAEGFSEQVLSFDTLTTVFENRLDGVEYEVRGRTETSDVTGNWTDAVSVTVIFAESPRITDIRFTSNETVEVDVERFDSSSVGGYELYRSETEGSLGELVRKLSYERDTFIDSSVEPMTEYHYTVKRVSSL